jgi:hypothetical protein
VTVLYDGNVISIVVNVLCGELLRNQSLLRQQTRKGGCHEMSASDEVEHIILQGI